MSDTKSIHEVRSYIVDLRTIMRRHAKNEVQHLDDSAIETLRDRLLESLEIADFRNESRDIVMVMADSADELMDVKFNNSDPRFIALILHYLVQVDCCSELANNIKDTTKRFFKQCYTDITLRRNHQVRLAWYEAFLLAIQKKSMWNFDQSIKDEVFSMTNIREEESNLIVKRARFDCQMAFYKSLGGMQRLTQLISILSSVRASNSKDQQPIYEILKHYAESTACQTMILTNLTAMDTLWKNLDLLVAFDVSTQEVICLVSFLASLCEDESSQTALVLMSKMDLMINGPRPDVAVIIASELCKKIDDLKMRPSRTSKLLTSVAKQLVIDNATDCLKTDSSSLKAIRFAYCLALETLSLLYFPLDTEFVSRILPPLFYPTSTKTGSPYQRYIPSYPRARKLGLQVIMHSINSAENMTTLDELLNIVHFCLNLLCDRNISLSVRLSIWPVVIEYITACLSKNMNFSKISNWQLLTTTVKKCLDDPDWEMRESTLESLLELCCQCDKIDRFRGKLVIFQWLSNLDVLDSVKHCLKAAEPFVRAKALKLLNKPVNKSLGYIQAYESISDYPLEVVVGMLNDDGSAFVRREACQLVKLHVLLKIQNCAYKDYEFVFPIMKRIAVDEEDKETRDDAILFWKHITECLIGVGSSMEFSLANAASFCDYGGWAALKGLYEDVDPHFGLASHFILLQMRDHIRKHTDDILLVTLKEGTPKPEVNEMILFLLKLPNVYPNFEDSDDDEGHFSEKLEDIIKTILRSFDEDSHIHLDCY